MAKKHVAVSLRKPPSPEKLDAFVAAGADRPAPSPSAPPESGVQIAAPATNTAVSAPAPASAPAAVPASAPAAVPASAPVAAPAPVAAAPPDTEPAPATEPESAVEPPPQVADATPMSPGVEVGGRAMRAVTVYLPCALADRLAVHCIELDRDMSNVVGEALEQHLQPRLGPGTWSPEARPTSEEAEPAPPRSGPYRAQDPFRWADPFRANPRVDRVIQLGRVLVTLWRQRPWAA